VETEYDVGSATVSDGKPERNKIEECSSAITSNESLKEERDR